ncbi:MAG: hypothetical protein L0206_13530 [Actinobacteria bacterium]|nr:hypothetical protein [Actinomycetota bacterium]
MHGLIDPFYEAAPGGQPNNIQRGQICEDQPVYLPAKWGLRITRVDPMDDRNVGFEITGRTEDVFSHAPLVGPPPLADGEAFIVGKAKLRRPVIVLAGEGFELFAGPQAAKPSDTFLCAPVYGGDQYAEEMRKRVRAYEYSNFFYLPQSKSPLFREGMVRFDHVQAIRRDHLRNRARAQLTADALLALQDWLYHYLTGRLSADSLIGEYRAEELARLTAQP